jgi:Flp pilus assembly protein CpaB
MTDLEKLRALLPHWMEHNDEHAAEYERWAATAALAGHEQAAEWIRSAAQQMAQASLTLRQALDELGGPLSPETGPYTH